MQPFRRRNSPDKPELFKMFGLVRLKSSVFSKGILDSDQFHFEFGSNIPINVRMVSRFYVGGTVKSYKTLFLKQIWYQLRSHDYNQQTLMFCFDGDGFPSH